MDPNDPNVGALTVKVTNIQTNQESRSDRSETKKSPDIWFKGLKSPIIAIY